ncbi:platelet-activating factor acetylhydrolase IB subunit beta [Nerophis ophidion]|uniref:platelet-activating factor acetylhydrolase IB subunit beta n=1 Tax=Nerophis ophidion TaxID=159077 RepID=UPI002ADF075F|nr:platelet-activating factor acetylhydrolase IB subunit beta [Nerophis ophidion]
MGEVRKLQKKLRQIENLEIKISLTPEEEFKISRKEELRRRLAELQLQLCGPQRTLGIRADGEEAEMKRQVEDAPEAFLSQAPPASKILRGEEEKCKCEAGPAPPATRKATGGTANTAQRQERTQNVTVSHHGGRDTPEDGLDHDDGEQEDADFTALKRCWQKSKFRLRLLEGHNDIITCVVAVDNLVVSGSRDTTVKVWHVPTATEHKNLGGHTAGVTCLSAPPPEYCKKLAWLLSLSEKERFILSGSADCNVKIWALSIGQCVKSIYTFNVVTALCFVPEGDGYIITGSDGGKVQTWNWHTLDNCQSINAHQEAVTSIQSQGPLVFSASTDGGVSVWENRFSDRDPLRLLHRWSGQVTGCEGGRVTLSPRGDKVLLAYGQAWIKILHWTTGTISRLTNHSSITGVTDCVHQTAGLLIASCYDFSDGESMLNLFSVPQCRYLASLTWQRAARILCFAAWTTGSGYHRWVTGGRDLVVWEQLPASEKQRGDVTVRTDSRLESPLESEGDTADDEQTDDEHFDDDEDGRQGEEADGESTSWLRCLLQ